MKSPSEGPARRDDRSLVAAFLGSADESAFRRLYAAHAPRLYLSLLRLSGGRQGEAEELLQETWIRAAAGLASFRWQSALSTWLHGIALNVWRESLRTHRAEPLPLEALPEEALAPPRPEGGAGRLDLERAVLRLPDGYREVLVLHDIEGYTHEEIADRLGIAPGTSKSQLSRARDSLRRWLAPAAARIQEETLR